MEELALITRKDVIALMGFKSLHGFNNFLKKHPDFPKPVKEITAFQGVYVSLRKRLNSI